MHAIASSSEINSENGNQIAWLNRECGGEVLLVIRLSNKERYRRKAAEQSRAFDSIGI